MLRTAIKFPFLTYAAACIALLAGAAILQAAGSGYDDGGFGGLGALLYAASEYLALPFHAAFRVLSSLPHPWGVVIGCLLVVAICFAVDTLLQRIRQRSKAA